MPQGQRIRPRAHGDSHLKPGAGAELGDWRPEQFVAVRTLLTNCEGCQACLFESDGEDAGHLYEGATAAIVKDQINQDLSLIARHLRECLECTQAILDAEKNASAKEGSDELDFDELDFDNPHFQPADEAEE